MPDDMTRFRVTGVVFIYWTRLPVSRRYPDGSGLFVTGLQLAIQLAVVATRGYVSQLFCRSISTYSAFTVDDIVFDVILVAVGQLVARQLAVIATRGYVGGI